MLSPKAKKNKTTKASLMLPKDFKARVKMHIKVSRELEKLRTEAIKNKGTVTKGGRTLTGTEITALRTLNLKSLNKLSAIYAKTYTRAKADRVSPANGGFRQPIEVKQILINFFRNAPLGTTGGKGASGPALQSLLPFVQPIQEGQKAYASRAILTTLFTLYAKAHNLSLRARDNQANPNNMNHQLLSVDEYMNNALDPLLTRLEQKSAQDLADKGVRDGDRKPLLTPKGRVRKYLRDDGTQVWNDHYHQFRRDNFSYSSLQSIYNQDFSPLNQTAEDGSRPFLVEPAELAKAYMTEVERLNAMKPSQLNSPGHTFADIAAQAAASLGMPVTFALQLRAALDDMHWRLQGVSETYSVERPKKPAARKPKKVVQ
jgi:hypothetical protein